MTDVFLFAFVLRLWKSYVSAAKQRGCFLWYEFVLLCSIRIEHFVLLEHPNRTK